MKNEIDRFLDGFIEAKKEALGGNTFGKFVRYDIPRAFFETSLLDDKEYLVYLRCSNGTFRLLE